MRLVVGNELGQLIFYEDGQPKWRKQLKRREACNLVRDLMGFLENG